LSRLEHSELVLGLIENLTNLEPDPILKNLPCYLLNNEKEERPKKHRKYSADIISSAHNGPYHSCDSNAELCYLNLPEDMVEDNPLDLENIKEKQDEDNDLQQSLTKHPDWYSRKNINDVNDILCYTKTGDNAANWKIVLPKGLILPTIRWYHQVTGHPGSKSSINTYINNIITAIYADLLKTSSAIIAIEIN
jgi:hypothetical protein